MCSARKRFTRRAVPARSTRSNDPGKQAGRRTGLAGQHRELYELYSRSERPGRESVGECPTWQDLGRRLGNKSPQPLRNLLKVQSGHAFLIFETQDEGFDIDSISYALSGAFHNLPSTGAGACPACPPCPCPLASRATCPADSCGAAVGRSLYASDLVAEISLPVASSMPSSAISSARGSGRRGQLRVQGGSATANVPTNVKSHRRCGCKARSVWGR